MAIAGLQSANLQAARTAFETGAADVFDQDPVGIYQRITDVQTGVEGAFISQIEAGATPTLKQWEGTRDRQAFRMLSKRYDMRKYQATLEIVRTELEWDTTGSVGRRINTFLANSAYYFDKLVMEELLTNPTGVDGVALLSNSHTHGAANATWDNLTTDALNFNTYDSAVAAMRTLQFENSEFRDVEPDVLIVGPDLARTAKEITGSKTRPIGLSATTGVPATSAATGGGAQVDNVMFVGGTMDVLVSKRFNDGSQDSSWLLVDSRYKPMSLGVGRPMTAVSITDADASERFNEDVYLFGLEVDCRAYPGSIYGIYGNLS